MSEREKCWKCLDGLMHSVCPNDGYMEPLDRSMWNDDESELEKRVEELESRMEEMWARMKQYEAVMSTAFRIRDAGEWRNK